MNFMELMPQLFEGLKVTLKIFFLTLIFSLPLGVIVSLGRISKFKILQKITGVYVLILRGTPLLLQIIFIYFGLPAVGISVLREPAALVAMILNYAAYFAEIFRSGIEAIPVGQHEAASVLGYTRSQTFVRIVLPQMMRIVLPPVTNEVITLVKDTSLAFALAYTEMFTLAKQIAAANASIMPLFVAGVFYYIFNFVVAWVMETIEKKMRYYK